MAKIRAYKLAEELGIERGEFVEKARAVGVELKSAMAGLEESEAEQLRAKLGGVSARGDMEEKRVVRGSGAVVVRRRRKVIPAPPPAEVETPTPVVEPGTPDPIAAPESLEQPVPAPIAASATADTASVEPDAVETPATAEPAAVSPLEPAAVPDPKETPGRGPQPLRPSEPAAATPDRKGRQRKRVREVVNLREQEQFARQVTSRGGQRRPSMIMPRAMASPRSRRRDAAAPRAKAKPAATEQKRVVRISGEISIGELAKVLGVKAAQIQAKLMALGTMVSMNQAIDVETAHKVTDDFGFEVQDVGFKEAEFLEAPPQEAGEDANRVPRPPVITVMGHVDHGKTSLLDAIRQTAVAEGEAGGITQHIGAYQTEARGHTLTFIDTPGHAAFTAMRARGAQVTDLVVLVVAATDGVMPQTIEAIEHARAAKCPILVAVNKIDLPEANAQQTRQRLMEHGLVPEEFGGDVICVDVSAKTGQGLDQLLEMLSLQAELLELLADPSRRARGVVLEAELDRGRGPVATVLIKEGTLVQGNVLVAGKYSGRVRMLENDRGERLKEAGPSLPVRVIGLSGVPEAGAEVHVVESERVAKQIIDHRISQERSKPAAARPRVTLEEFFAKSDGEGVKELPVVLKADVQGTLEVVRDSLEKLSTDAVKLSVISAGVGGINENDVTLAGASSAIVVGFNVRPDPAARQASDSRGVDVRVYRVIMNLLDEVTAAMAGLLPPTFKENVIGRAEVRQTFTIPKIGTIGGSLVTEGRMRRNAQVRLIRDGVQVYQGVLESLKRFKDDAREVQSGVECGIGVEGYNDLKVGDVIEAYELEEQPATL